MLSSFIKGIDFNNYPLDNDEMFPSEDIEKMENCEWLNLKRNGIHSLPKAVTDLPKLESLSLAYNKISGLREANFESSQSLQVLDLRNNRLSKSLVEDSTLQKLESLTVLDLSDNNLTVIPPYLEQLKELRFLSLKNTRLSSINGGLFISLTKLTHLDLSDNDLDTLPAQLRRLVNLKTLVLNNNTKLFAAQLRQLTATTKLEVLHLSNTGRNLDNIPSEIGRLPNLYDLDLSNNELQRIPEVVYSISGLKRLNLSDNSISQIPECIDSLLQIETLNLSRNNLAALPGSFTRLVALRVLYLDSNQLTREGLPNSMSRLQNLELFSAAFNKLTSVPDSLCRCTKLRKIILTRNELVTLPEIVHYLNLKELNTSENPDFSMPAKPVTTPQSNDFYNIDFSVDGQLEKLRLKNNKMKAEKEATKKLGRQDSAATRKLRIHKRKEEESNSSEAAKVLQAMRDVASKERTANVDEAHELAQDIDEIRKPQSWTERLERPDVDYKAYFEDDIGDVSGVTVWYMDKFQPEYVNDQEYGTFYEKDCYLVLLNEPIGNDEFNHKLYFWIGRESERDKQTCAAVHAVNLRNFIRATCRCVREEQDDESEEFIALFGDKFEIKHGGYGHSGFKHYVPPPSNRLLYCLSLTGQQAGMHLVPFMPASLDPRYIFLLDLSRALFLWVGNHTPKTQLSKAKLLADKINKFERKGTSKVLVVRQGAEPPQFWSSLLLEHGQTPEPPTEWIDLTVIKRPNLYSVIMTKDKDSARLSFELPSVEREEWALRPSVLLSNGVYILDGQTAVFVWVGRRSKRVLQQAGKQLGNDILAMLERLDDEVGVMIEREGFESVFFKSFFVNWPDTVEVDFTKDSGQMSDHPPENIVEMRHDLSALFSSRLSDYKLEEAEDDRLYFQEDLDLMQALVFDGKTWNPIPVQEYGQFYSADSYVYRIWYKHPDEEADPEANPEDDDSFKEEHAVYFWQGRDASNKAFLHYNFELLKKIKAKSNPDSEIKINQQQEDIQFILSLNREIVIHRGSRKEALDPCSERHAPRLYCVRSNAGSLFLRCIEVDCCARQLNSAYGYILFVPFDEGAEGGLVYVWLGSKAPEDTLNMTRRFASKIFPSEKYTRQEIDEGCEPAETFWRALGGKIEYDRDADYMSSVKLFRCSNIHGYFGVSSKFIDFCQDDLSHEDVMILDTGTDDVFLWLGERASDMVLKLAYNSAAMYVRFLRRTNPKKRLKATKKRFEPWEFTRVFHGWNQWPVEVRRFK